MATNMFAEAQKKREAEQAQIKSSLGLKTAKTSKRKVRIDASVPVETKDKLKNFAEAKDLSASVVLQMLIDEGCNL